MAQSIPHPTTTSEEEDHLKAMTAAFKIQVIKCRQCKVYLLPPRVSWTTRTKICNWKFVIVVFFTIILLN